MKYQERVSTREDVRNLYQRVLQDACIEQYRGYTSCNSYGWDEVADDYIKKDGEAWFDNPAYAPAKGKWRETLKGLIETPAIMGCDVMVSPIETYVKELVGSYEAYLRQQIQVHCDPDVLEQTAKKNKELMETLAQIDKEMESGELIHVKRAQWKPFNDEWFDFFYCSECGRKERRKEPYCHCGCKMDLEETDEG